MIRIINIILLCTLSVASQGQVIVDANAETRQLTGSFEKINVAGNIKVIISPSTALAMAVSADEGRDIDDINTSVKENTLFISLGDNKFWKSRKKGHTVYLSIQELTAIEASGASDIIIVGDLQVKHILLSLSGASSFKGSLLAAKVKMELRGASEAKLFGSANDFQINCSGASDLDGFAFIVQRCIANASGASDIQVTAKETLTLNASGASHIYYKGNAVVAGLSAHGVSKIVSKN